jgi:formate dehydrogenase subunit gamma
LPLAGYVWAAAEQQQGQATGDDATNPRSEYWRDVRAGVTGYTSIVGQETNVLIQSRGETWREIRNGPVITIGAIMVIGVILGILAYHLKTGGAKLEHRTGRKVLRWPMVDRVLHWYTAILFIILAITGLSLLWGRIVLIPVAGKEGFAAWANLAKPVHDYLALFFAAGLAVMILKWFKHNIPRAYDRQWFKDMGGYFNGTHPPAGFTNGGEKAYYWLLVVAGTAIVASGFYMLFPNLGFERAAMQNANIIHGVSSLLVITAVCAHIYLGTAGSEGAFEGMVSGEVDEGWAKQHHSLWYDEVKNQGGVGGAARRTGPRLRRPGPPRQVPRNAARLVIGRRRLFS